MLGFCCCCAAAGMLAAITTANSASKVRLSSARDAHQANNPACSTGGRLRRGRHHSKYDCAKSAAEADGHQIVRLPVIVRFGSCVTSIAMSPGDAQLYER